VRRAVTHYQQRHYFVRLRQNLYPLGHAGQRNIHMSVFLRRPCIIWLARPRDFIYTRPPSLGHGFWLSETRLARLLCSAVFRQTKTLERLLVRDPATIAQW
jgi:hypothetical protein